LAFGIKYNLEAEGYEVTTAGDGPAALKLFEENPQSPDLVILDLQIGNMGGVAAAIDLRLEESGGRLPRARILLLLDRRDDAFIARRADVDLTLVKPGAHSNPFHFHHAEEEAFYILEGHGILRQGDETGEDERIEIRAGKLGMADFFDVNAAGSDSHLQFTNWTVDNNGAYDYAADTRGYTYGYGRRVAHSDTLTSVVPIQYLSFWRKEANGWKLVAWLISAGGADAPPTAPSLCTNPRPPEYTASHDSTAIATARAADLDFSARSVKAGAGPAFAEFVAPDGASVGTGKSEVTCGHDAVAKALEGIGPGVLTWAPRVADAAPSGDLAFTSGDAIIKDGNDISYSNYLTIWKRQADGKWRFVADGGNSAPAPAAH